MTARRPGVKGPPPLPPAAAQRNFSASPSKREVIARELATADAGFKWFMPVLIGATLASLGIAALVLYSNRAPAVSTAASIADTAGAPVDGPNESGQDHSRKENARGFAERKFNRGGRKTSSAWAAATDCAVQTGCRG